jgi:CheY-like chemotaxis protein
MSEASRVILIVDDEPDMCWVLEHVLASQGLVTRRALGAQETLNLLEQQHYACVFLDAKLPDMDGLELARGIREMAPGTPIIMVSGYFYRDDLAIQEAISQGLISDFISKPFLQEEILKALKIYGHEFC